MIDAFSIVVVHIYRKGVVWEERRDPFPIERKETSRLSFPRAPVAAPGNDPKYPEYFQTYNRPG